LDIKDCKLAEVENNTVETYISLLQLSNYDKIKVRQCKMEIDHHFLLQHELAYFGRAKWPKSLSTDIPE